MAEVGATDNRLGPAELVRGGIALGEVNSLDWPVVDDEDGGLDVDIVSRIFPVLEPRYGGDWSDQLMSKFYTSFIPELPIWKSVLYVGGLYRFRHEN